MKKRKRKLNEAEHRAKEYIKAPRPAEADVVCYFDGCCEPINPGGNMGIGATVRKDDKEIFRHSKFVPFAKENSNNVAEYMAFEAIIDFIKGECCWIRSVQIYGDSALVINQMFGSWRMKGGRYLPYAKRCMQKLHFLKTELQMKITGSWIGRDFNSYADELSKAELLKNNVQFRIQPITNEEKEKIIIADWKGGQETATIKPDYVHARFKQ